MSDAFETLLFEELDAVALGEVKEPAQDNRKTIEEPTYIPLRPISACVLCGVITVWKSEGKNTPVHPRCVRDYLRRKAEA